MRLTLKVMPPISTETVTDTYAVGNGCCLQDCLHNIRGPCTPHPTDITTHRIKI